MKILLDMEDRFYTCLIQDPEVIKRQGKIQYKEAETFPEMLKCT